METRYKHVVLNEDYIPGIAGTAMKIVELLVEQQAYGWRPEELRFQHPYLTLGQAHSALAYYYHREELATTSHSVSNGPTSCVARSGLQL